MLQKVLSRSFHASSASLVKVAVLGAAGGIGQPLSLLLKDIDAITHLSRELSKAGQPLFQPHRGLQHAL